MSDMPREIAVWKFIPEKTTEWVHGGWSEDHDHKTTSYTRTDTLTALLAENARLRDALDWAYSGDGLDKCAIMIGQMNSPFTKVSAPCHATQIGLRKVLDAIRKRAAIPAQAQKDGE